MQKKILALALPMAGTQLIVMGSSFLCMTMLATLGHEVLAASALLYTTQIAITVIGMSLLFSLSFLIGHAYGANHFSAIGTLVQQGWIFGILISLPMMFLFAHIDTFLLWAGEPKQVVEIAQTFFNAHNWRVLPLMWGVCNQQLCYGVRWQKLDLLTNFLSVFVLLIVSYILIFGKMGFPALGVAGFGYAISAQAWFYFIFTTFYFRFGKEFKKFSLFRFRAHLDGRSLARLLKVGWPISVQSGGELSSFMATTAMMGWLGVTTLGAFQVVIQYALLFIVPIFAMSQASGVLVGQACGAQQFSDIPKLGNASLKIALMIVSSVVFIFFIFPKPLASLYIDVNNPHNAELTHLSLLLLRLNTVFLALDSLRHVITGTLRGLLDTRYPMIVGILALWGIGIPLGYTFGFIFGWGAVGIFIGNTLGMMTGAGLLFLRWKKKSTLLIK